MAEPRRPHPDAIELSAKGDYEKWTNGARWRDAPPGAQAHSRSMMADGLQALVDRDCRDVTKPPAGR